MKMYFRQIDLILNASVNLIITIKRVELIQWHTQDSGLWTRLSVNLPSQDLSRL